MREEYSELLLSEPGLVICFFRLTAINVLIRKLFFIKTLNSFVKLQAWFENQATSGRVLLSNENFILLIEEYRTAGGSL